MKGGSQQGLCTVNFQTPSIEREMCRGTPIPCNAESLEALEKGWVQEEEYALFVILPLATGLVEIHSAGRITCGFGSHLHELLP